MFSASSRRHHRLGAALALAATSMLIASPAHAQFVSTVFDPSNYSQNILTAARTLQQINNQITMLQNQAQSLINQAKNLTTVAFPELSAISQTINQVNQLMGQAQSIEFKVANLDSQFKTLFPTSFNQALTGSQQVAAARTRLSSQMSAFQQTMTVQAQITENITADTNNLASLSNRSQSAQGSLQAQQATNQLLALIAKQQLQLQTMMAAQYRAEALYQAGQTQSVTDGQDATIKFLGSGKAYNP
ncbi:P-type conjugative transfer protein TrbJ [Novosphingobium terrae]|uniref:P-type conjugative transfer protein TrbJ n=1 Tax=Novosphingobium terrae TaxID=2726189 RepID=UPI0019815831|nr:P-type conjugative transfer protein TrbJ [Novosphingobium terrae]